MGVEVGLIQLLLLQEPRQLGVEALLKLVVKLSVAEPVLLPVGKFVAVRTRKLLKLSLDRGLLRVKRPRSWEWAGWDLPGRTPPPRALGACFRT